jgi:hypothetical protein
LNEVQLLNNPEFLARYALNDATIGETVFIGGRMAREYAFIDFDYALW